MKTILEFEDHGQDFLEWEVDEDGIVTGSNLQAFVWVGLLLEKLPHEYRAGDTVSYIRDEAGKGVVRTIRYPLKSVRKGCLS
jgi:hypothetical protein